MVLRCSPQPARDRFSFEARAKKGCRFLHFARTPCRLLIDVQTRALWRGQSQAIARINIFNKLFVTKILTVHSIIWQLYTTRSY